MMKILHLKKCMRFKKVYGGGSGKQKSDMEQISCNMGKLIPNY